MTQRLFYQPESAGAGDYIPFYWQGYYHLFYLRFDPATLPFVRGVGWWHVVTRDFIHFVDWGCALPAGPADAQDMNAFTGCIVAAEDRFYLFYTGNNWDYAERSDRHREAVMMAISDDLRHWEKVSAWAFYPDTSHYEKNEWRDPFVCRQGDEYWMLLQARRKKGLPAHRGCTARAVSRDLRNWSIIEPLYAPGTFHSHECPDLFRMDGRDYLLFSDYSVRHETMYRIADGPQGPWRCTHYPMLDSDACYAAKTAADDRHRYLFGWIAGRKGECDAGELEWGGPLVVHELTAQKDGSLAVSMPRSIREQFDIPHNVKITYSQGEWCESDTGTVVEASDRTGFALFNGPVEPWLVSLGMVFEGDCQSFGIILRYGESTGNYYALQLEPERGRLALVRIQCGAPPRRLHERPLDLVAGRPVRLEVLVDGDCLVAYANHKVALSARLYDFREGNWGLFAFGGSVRFSDIQSLNENIFMDEVPFNDCS